MGIFPVAGTFRYVLHGISDSGCSGYDTIVIGVFTRSGFEAPTAFTPNNDGLNDFLVPIPVMNSVLVSFKVYNRNKVLLFSTSIPNDGWDGTYKGVKQDPDTYYWEVFYHDNAGTLRNITGSSLLIR
jgi:gliding motility-associated-like protein